MITGPIVIVEDDADDKEIYSEAMRAIGITNELRFFEAGQPVLDYLSTTEDKPFIILSDINMPGMSGLELKRRMEDDPYLKAKGIPFVFISTNATKASVRHAHALSVQGYFEKPNKMEDIKDMLRTLFSYWDRCKHINNT